MTIEQVANPAGLSQSSFVSRHLYSIRINAGYDNISEYLKNIDIPISDNYYRDVEGGRKTLSLETAIGLANSLNLPVEGREELIWNFLRDALPADLEQALLIPRVDRNFSNVAEARDVLDRELHLYRNAAAIRQFEDNFMTDDTVYGKLADNINYLPILHHIFLSRETTEVELRRICAHESVAFDKGKICDFLEGAGVEIFDSNGVTHYRRQKPVFRVSSSTNGRRLTREFVEGELAKSRGREPAKDAFDPTGNTFQYSRLVSASTGRIEVLRQRMQDLLAEMTLANDELGSTDATPFFVCCLVSARPEYAPPSTTLNESQSGGT